jgi:hypothetical protein
MDPWLETVGVTLLALAGVLLGWCFSRLRRPWWLLGYFIPFALVLAYAAAMPPIRMQSICSARSA